MKRRSYKFTERQVAKALIQAGGLHTVAARRLMANPQTIRNYINRSKALQALHYDITERNLDRTETALFKCITTAP